MIKTIFLYKVSNWVSSRRAICKITCTWKDILKTTSGSKVILKRLLNAAYEVVVLLPKSTSSPEQFFFCHTWIDELFSWNGWPMNAFMSYFHPEPFSEILTIANLRHVPNKVWTCGESGSDFFKLRCAVVITTLSRRQLMILLLGLMWPGFSVELWKLWE